MLTLASALREIFGVQLYKNNARALLSRILSILNLDWLQHARTVRVVYECKLRCIDMVHVSPYITWETYYIHRMCTYTATTVIQNMKWDKINVKILISVAILGLCKLGMFLLIRFCFFDF